MSPQATDDEIKKAYRRLARECHPDANPDDPQAAERFKEISAAYDSVRDPERRRQYDMFGPGGAGRRREPVHVGSVRPQRPVRRVLQRRRLRWRAWSSRGAARARRRDADGAHARRGCQGRSAHGRDAHAGGVRDVRRFRRRAGHARVALHHVRRRGRGSPDPALAARPDRDRRSVPDVLGSRNDHRASVPDVSR